MKYYAVIDTNVVVSAMLKRDSIPGKIIDLVNMDVIVPLMNGEILDEYFDVLSRNKFGFTMDEVEYVLKSINEKAMFFDREKTFEKFIDSDDIVFYEIVLSARTILDAYLVTGNTKHYPIKKYVVTPREMLEIIDSSFITENI